MFTNHSDIPLPLSVWLAQPDDYDFKPSPNTVSNTALQKPLRALVLAPRLPSNTEVDLSTLIPAALGKALHASAEKAWLENYEGAFRNLGYPDKVIKRVRVNPEYPHACKDDLDIYVEQRKEKDINGFTISGKYDFVVEGDVHDIKFTKTFSYMSGSSTREYILQGSINKWLNQDIIYGDHIHINYIFTDWAASKATYDPKYPKTQCIVKRYPLLSIPDTEAYLVERTNLIKKFIDAPQEELPKCNRRELWQDEATYAYYKDPTKTTRATKLFNALEDAHVHLAKNKGKGIVQERPGKARRCNYCEARAICTQATELELGGLL